jgi:hypothetical protein
MFNCCPFKTSLKISKFGKGLIKVTQNNLLYSLDQIRQTFRNRAFELGENFGN